MQDYFTDSMKLFSMSGLWLLDFHAFYFSTFRLFWYYLTADGSVVASVL